MTVDTQLISSIGKGVLVFAAVAQDDTPKEVESMAAKVLKMRMWPDDAGSTVCLAYSSILVPTLMLDSIQVEAQCTGYKWGGSLQ